MILNELHRNYGCNQSARKGEQHGTCPDLTWVIAVESTPLE
jgi:hypothetical protein